MSSLYLIRKKVGANPIVEATIKKFYMIVKEKRLRKSAILEIEKAVHKVNEKDKILFYLDVPTHPNMGDLAQYCCIKNWLAENYSEYNLIEMSAETITYAENEFIAFLKNHDDKENIIFFQSGYCTQDLGGAHDYIHKLVIKNMRNIPIVMLPQTIMYKNKNREIQAQKVYEQNSHVMLMCRDKVSYQMAQSIFPKNRLELYPDIVTSLIGTMEIASRESRKGILICCRNDTERFYSDDEIEYLKKELEKIDEVEISDTTVQDDFKNLKANINGHVEAMIKEFGKYRAVVTDRYHGTIFSLIAGTPVIVIKSNDHKVVTGVDWFKGIYDSNVCYISDINRVVPTVRSIYDKFDYHELKPHFKEEYYSKLKDVIEQWRKA